MGSGGLRSARFPADEDQSAWILYRLQPAALAFPRLGCLIWANPAFDETVKPAAGRASRSTKPAKQQAFCPVLKPHRSESPQTTRPVRRNEALASQLLEDTVNTRNHSQEWVHG